MMPFLWMLVAAFNPAELSAAGMASLIPSYVPTLGNFAEAWASADFPRYGLNTAIISLGILAVQIVTITLGRLCLRAAWSFPAGRSASTSSCSSSCWRRSC